MTVIVYAIISLMGRYLLPLGRARLGASAVLGITLSSVQVVRRLDMEAGLKKAGLS